MAPPGLLAAMHALHTGKPTQRPGQRDTTIHWLHGNTIDGVASCIPLHTGCGSSCDFHSSSNAAAVRWFHGSALWTGWSPRNSPRTPWRI